LDLEQSAAALAAWDRIKADRNTRVAPMSGLLSDQERMKVLEGVN
jgi:hypothetical protein